MRRGEHGQRDGRAGSDRDALARGRPDVELLELAREHDRDAREPGVGDQQVGAATDHERRDAGDVPGDRGEIVLGLGPHDDCERPAAAVGGETGARHVARHTPREARRERRRDVVERRTRRHDASQVSGRLVRSPAPSVSTTSPGPAKRRGTSTRSAARGKYETGQGRRRVDHGVHDQPARHPGDRPLARGIHVGEHDRVGVVERVGEVAPQRCGARVAVGLEHGDHAPPAAPSRAVAIAAATSPGRCA